MFQKRLSDFDLVFIMAFIFLGNLFAISGKGDRDCLKEWHGSYEEMNDEKQCKEFAETYGHSFKTETDSGYPRGCYVNNKNAYFNKHSQGSAESNSKPICRKS